MLNNRQILIAIDQLANTIIGGYADETLSARAYRRTLRLGTRSRLHTLINALFFWQDDHCKHAWINECERKQLPEDYKAL